VERLAFVVLTVLALTSAAIVVLPAVRNAVVCALALAFNLVAMAGFFLLLRAQFIALLQVIVYAGAILVLILFVIMLLNIKDERRLGRSGPVQRLLGPALAAACGGLLGWVVSAAAGERGFPAPSPEFGTVRALGVELFTRFFYPFEAISLLLVVAMIGAVLLAKRRL
jgi:NADH-quinone oxidoreductase subunit J